MRSFLHRHFQVIVNLILVVSMTRFFALQAIESYNSQEFHVLEAIWLVHNLILVGFILTRKNHIAIQADLRHQGIALGAFFSGALLDLRIKTSEAWLLWVSHAVLLMAIVAGIVVLINLGRSFGILIAVREVKTGGLYAWVRHPMYATDILMRFGIIFRHYSPFNLAVAVISTFLYYQRAVYEEHFLKQFPEYQEYMEKVKSRFIPGII